MYEKNKIKHTLNMRLDKETDCFQLEIRQF